MKVKRYKTATNGMTNVTHLKVNTGGASRYWRALSLRGGVFTYHSER
jgi:hypothetical protein